MSIRDKRPSYLAIRSILSLSFFNASYALSQREPSVTDVRVVPAARAPRCVAVDVSAPVSPLLPCIESGGTEHSVPGVGGVASVAGRRGGASDVAAGGGVDVVEAACLRGRVFVLFWVVWL